MAIAEVRIEDHSAEVLKVLQDAIEAGLTAIGLSAEGHAKKLCPVDTGRLRNSITNIVDAGDKSVIIGTNVEYAPYIELGTGVFAEGGVGRQTPWAYQDSKGEWHTTSGMKAHPYLRPAVQDYRAEYKALLEQAMKNAET